MKKSILMMFAGLLFSAMPAFGGIYVNLENPANGTSVSGLTLVSGWAFSDSGAAVTVSLRVNGKTTETTVLCCGPRQARVLRRPTGSSQDRVQNRANRSSATGLPRSRWIQSRGHLWVKFGLETSPRQ